MKVYALMTEEPDSYDIGTHLELQEVFAERKVAERVKAELVGKLRNPVCLTSMQRWDEYEIEIVEVTVR